MFKPTNFSERHEASVKVFVKAKEELITLHVDLLNEEAATEKHLAAVKKRREAVAKSLDSINTVLG